MSVALLSFLKKMSNYGTLRYALKCLRRRTMQGEKSGQATDIFVNIKAMKLGYNIMSIKPM